MNLLGEIDNWQEDFFGEPMVYLYARMEDATNGWLEDRVKIVRAEFTESIDVHWSLPEPPAQTPRQDQAGKTKDL